MSATELKDEKVQRLNQPALDTLPIEILVEIFSFLGRREDLISCCRVSKSFYSAAVNSSLWKSLCCKVWKITQHAGENWKELYRIMYVDLGRYEHCYARIRESWDIIENYLAKKCPNILSGLNEGASEDELNMVEIQYLDGTPLPDDYRCFLRIHNGQKDLSSPGILGSTAIGNHFKQEALLSVNKATANYSFADTRLDCIPLSICLTNTCGHYMAITEEGGHKKGRIFWPSRNMDCFVMADNFMEWFALYSHDMVKEQFPVIDGVIYPYKFASQYTGSNGITVKTATCFLPELSNVEPPRYFFTYRITITMDPNFPKDAGCKLTTRHWYITDGNGKKEEVHGDAVVGNYPTMIPSARHEYVSCTSFTTPTGTMEGYYTFKFLHKHGITNAKISPIHFKAPPIELASVRNERCKALFSEVTSDTESD